uniref:60S ribosomal protein L35a isoform X1 n=1 Tax=Phascolarctos cinereus TaxID=38626 RepID=A0A6P5KAS1_PHACI|nr:60S ribosomal protein L35a isoform X1 [Phascolarctos cinereus]
MPPLHAKQCTLYKEKWQDFNGTFVVMFLEVICFFLEGMILDFGCFFFPQWFSRLFRRAPEMGGGAEECMSHKAARQVLHFLFPPSWSRGGHDRPSFHFERRLLSSFEVLPFLSEDCSFPHTTQQACWKQDF